MQPARSQIPQKIATSTNDMSLLNNFCQRNKVSLSVTYTELNPSRFTCRVAIEKFGTWDSRKAYRHKWEAKSCAAEVACVGVGLKKESDVTRPIVQQVVSVSKTSVPKVHGLPPKPIPLPPKPTSTMTSSSTAIPSTHHISSTPAIQQLPINLQQPSLTAPTTFPYHMIHFGNPGMSQIPYMAYPQAFGSSMNPIQQQYFQPYVQWPQKNQPETKNDE
ncbi:hypothetical protein BCR33DRAFT_711016 [Rhizoclosmatium globosum]|uniref:Uncharacterized protein n=1 Tax=Rhizoclosmatium globosum TaxID=329046 RepID=A0A1Y2D3A9_9FUNG|nr:hypothetical protein BCR33DRAFT_711016 [Rhizoclosmatium globosum]|eukprot:ORY53624.1 hypothetical protein BCR33DRAFT_711016 [Rhizoclosmatium globosum]